MGGTGRTRGQTSSCLGDAFAEERVRQLPLLVVESEAVREFRVGRDKREQALADGTAE